MPRPSAPPARTCDQEPTLTSTRPVEPAAAALPARAVTGQAWAYPLVITLLAVSLGVSGAPAPLYGLYVEQWGLSPVTTTVVFAVYAVGALGSVLVAGQVSDRHGRKPLLVGAAVAMLVGLGVFMVAGSLGPTAGVTALLGARFLHGLAVGTAVVVGGAALLDLRPDRGARSGQLTGVMFNVGMSVTILGAALLAEHGPWPLVTPYAVVAALVAGLLLGVLAMVEPHGSRPTTPIRLSRPAVPVDIRADFRFAALGVVSTWSVLGVYTSLFPAFASASTGVRGVVFGGATVAAMAGSAALSQALSGRFPARRAAVVGDVGTAAALGVSVLALRVGEAWAVAAAAVLIGLSFGVAFGGSIRHLGQVVPAHCRGEVMSAYYVLAYSALAFPTVLAGAAATTWGLAAVFPWFSLATAVLCLVAAGLGVRAARRGPAQAEVRSTSTA